MSPPGSAPPLPPGPRGVPPASPGPAAGVPPGRPFAAAAWMSGSIAGFMALAVAGRQIGLAAEPLDTFEMMFYRSALGLAGVVAGAALLGRLDEIGTQRLPVHAARNLIHFAGQNLWLFALGLIPLAQLFALEFSSPLLVALAAPWLLGERLSGARAAALVLGFAGILIVARPFGAAGVSPGLLAALASALCFAMTAIVTKRLTRVTPVVSILFWLTLMQTGLGLAFAGWDGSVRLPGPGLIPWVLMLGASGIAAHVGLTMALSLAPATVVTPIDFLRLPLIAIVGALAYAEPLDPWVFLGGALIFAANWVNISAESRHRTASS